jgi:hypothetical protein
MPRVSMPILKPDKSDLCRAEGLLPRGNLTTVRDGW